MNKPEVFIHVLSTQHYSGERLYGRCYNHPRFTNGTVIVTSPIKRRSKYRVETKNTIYRPISDSLYV